MNEQSIKEKLKSNADLYAQLQNLYVLYGSRSILAIAKSPALRDEVAHALVSHLASHGVYTQQRALPYTTLSTNGRTAAGSVENSFVLVSEMSDRQLALLASDKSEALKLIEARTGLRLRKIKKSVYFTGLLFQFVLLNALVADRVRETAVAVITAEKNNKNEIG